MSNVSTESELTQTADFCLHLQFAKFVTSIKIMNSRDRIHFILLFIQYYDLQVQIIAARTDAAERKMLFCMLTTLPTMPFLCIHESFFGYLSIPELFLPSNPGNFAPP